MQWNWLDSTLVAALAVGLVIGYARGLVGLLGGLMASIVGTLVAGRYATTVLAWVDAQYGLSARLGATIAEHLNLPPEANRVPASSLPFDKIVAWLKNLPLPASYRADLASHVQAWSTSAHGSETAAHFIARSIATGILTAVTFIILASVVGWLVGALAGYVSERLNHTPGLGSVNRLTGLLVGVLEAALVITVLLGTLLPLTTLPALKQLADAAAGSTLVPHFLAAYRYMSHWIFGRVDGFFFT